MARQPGFPARFPSGSRAPVRRYLLKSAETFKRGAFVLLEDVAGTDRVATCGADPAVILGLASEPAADVVEAGYALVWVADENTEFMMPTSSAPTAANINTAYGVAVDADGIWYVDFTDTVNTRVLVTDFADDDSRTAVLCKVLKANRQLNA